MSLKSINPFDQSSIATYDQVSQEKLDGLLNQASVQWQNWSREPLIKRAELLRNVSGILRMQKERYASIITREMGKAIKESITEVEKCALVCDYYAEHAELFLHGEEIKTEYQVSRVEYLPIGPVLAIMPWNFPFWQVFRFAAPNLMAGNVCILKHASNVSGCSLAIQDIFSDAGYSPGTFTSLLLKGSETEKLIGDDRIAAVTLTGSTQAGMAVGQAAGKAVKKAVLELGGSDPYIILEDADVQLAAEKCAAGRLLNAGQSCIGAKRFIVTDAVYDSFLDEFTKRMSETILGDPSQKETDMGPMASMFGRDELHFQVQKSIENGATLHLGGEIPKMEGAFYPPTILTNVKPGMPAYHDEMFGPVASVIKVNDEAEAIKVANDTIFGLGAAIFTNDLVRGRRIATKEINAGSVFVNDFVKSDPRLPFGGIKQSGYGRELSLLGIREFVNAKTIVVK